MKKVIKYDYLISETDGKKTFIGKTIPYSDEALEVAKREACEGEYKIEEISDSEPTLEERVTTIEETLANEGGSSGTDIWDEMAVAIEEGVNEV